VRAKKINHVGYAKTVLVVEDQQRLRGVISTVIARAVRPKAGKPGRASRGRLVIVTGAVTIAQDTFKHVNDVVAPLVNRIIVALGLAPYQYRLSVVNVPQASAQDLTACIQGLSAELPIFAAMLFAALELRSRSDVVLTGHVASPEGHLAPVSMLDDKFEGAEADPSLRIFVHSDGGDQQTGVPNSRRLRRVAVADISDALQTCVEPAELALASLRNGYFGKPIRNPGATDPVGRTVQFFQGPNLDRFDTGLAEALGEAHNEEVHELMECRARFHLRRGHYPHGLGETVRQRICSCPPTVRRHRLIFPLLPHDRLCLLGRLAKSPDDQEDHAQLFEACLGRHLEAHELCSAPGQANISPARGVEDAVRYVMTEISANNLARKYGSPIDHARSAFILPTTVASSYREFQDIYVSFYRHLLIHIKILPIPADDNMIAAQALKLVNEAFAEEGGHRAAGMEGLHALHGGMLLVTERMANQLKKNLAYDHTDQVIKASLASFDYRHKVEFMRAFISYLGNQLPEDVQARPPEDFVEHHEELVKRCVHSMDKIAEVFRGI
jgi:hypothetical protein